MRGNWNICVYIYYWEIDLAKYFNASTIELHIVCSQPIKAMQKKKKKKNYYNSKTLKFRPN